MANLMRALEESQQGYQHHNPNMAAMGYSYTAKPKRVWSMAFIVLLLPAAVAIGVTGASYIELRNDWVDKNQGLVEVVEIASPLIELSYPSFDELRDTQVEELHSWEQQVSEPSIDALDEPLSKATEDNVDSSSEDDLLDGIDLSGLSPEIAQRLQAAMQPEESQSSLVQNNPQAVQDKAIELTSTASQWIGTLPALDFQTHVYSSNLAKRWVKVNNIEYQQGDWLAEGVRLLTIEPQSCLIEFANDRIRIPALYDWKG